MHNQLTLPALIQATKRELPLIVDRIMGTLNQCSSPGGHITMGFRAQPIDKDTPRSATSNAEHSRLLSLRNKIKAEENKSDFFIPKNNRKYARFILRLLTFKEELLPAPANLVVAKAKLSKGRPQASTDQGALSYILFWGEKIRKGQKEKNSKTK